MNKRKYLKESDLYIRILLTSKLKKNYLEMLKR